MLHVLDCELSEISSYLEVYVSTLHFSFPPCLVHEKYFAPKSSQHLQLSIVGMAFLEMVQCLPSQMHLRYDILTGWEGL